MKSKHFGWQQRWTADHAAGTLTHECGLVVKFTGQHDARGEALNADATAAALAVKNGHNAAAMVTRMLREAAEIHAKGAVAARINARTPPPRISN